MTDKPGETTQLQQWLGRMQAGDLSAREELLQHYSGRLRQLARRMLKGFPGLRRWEETDDVYQNAMIRLLRALREVTPASPRHFLSLAATQLRRELIDLARHYHGPEGPGAHHASRPGNDDSDHPLPPAHERLDDTHEPTRVAAWSEFHERIAALPDEEREVFDLLWYHGLAQAEAAALAGVTVRTIKRRWQSARLRLRQALHGELPGSD